MQSESANTRRKWFQIHLSTAIVVMVTAAILLSANVKVLSILSEEDGIAVGCLGNLETKRWTAYYAAGWPIEFIYKSHYISHATYREGAYLPDYSRGEENPKVASFNFIELFKFHDENGEDEFYWGRLAIDFGVVLVILLLIKAVIEWLTRRFQRSTWRELQLAHETSSVKR